MVARATEKQLLEVMMQGGILASGLLLACIKPINIVE
jgi:hypothetical protein